MASTILQDISATIKNAHFYCIMADKVTDSSNKEQVVLWFRHVDEKGLVGLYQVNSVKHNAVLKDNIISNCRGQGHDGAANTADIRNGVAAQIYRKDQPQAMHSHCYGHALNLAASETAKKTRFSMMSSTPSWWADSIASNNCRGI